MSMPALASSPRMVGRQPELDALIDAFVEGEAGTPRTAIVRGEAGIGKTRLVHEFLAEAARRSSRLPLVTAVGQCVDLGPIGAPFGPIRRVLRDLHAAVGIDALREAAGSPAMIAALAAFVPGLGDDGPAPAADTGLEFAEVVEAVLENLSVRVHVVIVVEDLQWADAATLALLKTLATTLRGRHLTIVATYRSDDIDRFHPLRPVLAELERTRAIVRVEVRPLTADEVVEQVGLLPHSDLGEDGVRALADRSGGIPFLVEELVDLGDAQLPDTLRDLVLARYERLGDGARGVMRTMAAGGVHVDHDLLTGVVGVSEHELDLALRESIEAKVIFADGAGYTFRHALTQEAVEGEMLPSEQVRVHRRYAEVLGELLPDSPDAISAAAEHWLAAHELSRAFDTTVRALEESRSTFAPAASVKLVERLAELWTHVPDAAERAGTTLADLHLQASVAWQDLGDPERALRAANEGLASPIDDPVLRAALLRQRYVEEFNTRRDPDSTALDDVLELLEGIDSDRAKILLSRTLSNIALDRRSQDARSDLRRAVQLAEEAGSSQALAIALTNEAWRLSEEESDEVEALVPLERALALQLNPSARAYVGSAYTDMLNRLGRYDDAARAGQRHLDEAVDAGLDRGLGGDIALSTAQALFSAGLPEQALVVAHRARRLLDRASRIQVVRLLSTHYVWNDEPEAREALIAVERAAVDAARQRRPARSEWWVPASVDAVIAAAAGIPVPSEQAWAERLASVATVLEPADASPQSRRYAAIAAALMIRAIAVSRSTVDDDAVARMRSSIQADIRTWPDRGTARTLRRYVEAVLADADGAPVAERIAAWRGLVDDLADGSMPVRHRDLAELSLAAALLAAGDRDAAGSALRALADTAPGHGVARIGHWAERLAVSAGVADDRGAAAAPSIPSLTPREHQVLALVAEGLTNAQIGARLFISPKTASVHVSAILAKIGAGNRAEAAALFAAANGGA
jgi:DNA-binding CsgD family transcriptional regulator